MEQYYDELETINKAKQKVLKDICEACEKPSLTPTDYEGFSKAADILKDLVTTEAMIGYDESDYDISSRMMPDELSFNHDYRNSYKRGRSSRTGRYISRGSKYSLDDIMNMTHTPEERQVIERMMMEAERR